VDWTKSRNRWKRRSAAVSFLQEAKAGRSVDFIFEVSKRLTADADPMVLKGVGWLLKETYPKRPEEAVEFLRLNAFPRIVVRYAAEKMPAADRGEFGL
jgi:3-methyladenine DNA glycosylase AlkD